MAATVASKMAATVASKMAATVASKMAATVVSSAKQFVLVIYVRKQDGNELAKTDYC